MAARACLGGILTALAVAGCGGGPSQQERVLACLHDDGWTQTSRHGAVVTARAADAHASVELTFHRSEAAARRSLPEIVPIGEGWFDNVSFRSSVGFTYADEQLVDRCLGLSVP